MRPIAAAFAVAVAFLGCAGAEPRPVTGPRREDRALVPTVRDHPARAPQQSLEAIAAVRPRTLAAVHLAHVAQLEIARRDAGVDLTGPVIQDVWRGLGEALGSATPEDAALARDLADAAPRLVGRILDALTTGGVPGEHRAPEPFVARVVDEIVLEGPSAAKAWALENEYAGTGGDARQFVRTMLARAAESGRCPVADETLGRAVDALFGNRRGIPCLQDAQVSAGELARTSAIELLALIETGGQPGEAAAVALRTKVQEVDPRTPGALEALLGGTDFGRVMELAARGGVDRSLVMQLLTSAHDAPDWVDWLAEHPDRIGPAEREMAVLLIESDGRPAMSGRNRAALDRLRAASSTLPPAGPRFSMPDDGPATFAAAWQLAARVTDIGDIEGVYGELMRRTVADAAQRAAATRHDREIVAALARCRALVEARPATTWLDRTLREATASACLPVARLAASVYTPPLRGTLMDALRAGPDEWAVEVYDALELNEHEGDIPSAILDALAARTDVRGRLLMRPFANALWAHLPATERGETALLTAVARSHAQVLLGARPDRIGPPEPAEPGSPHFPRAFRVEVSSSELPGIPPQRILLGVLPHEGELRSSAIVRIAP